MNNISRSILHLIFCFSIFPINSLIGQVTPTIKFQNYKDLKIDTFILNEVLDSVLYITKDLQLSIKYAELYDSICNANPKIPNKLKRALFLKGNRYNSLAWNNNQNNLELALKYIDTALYYHNQAESKIGYWQDQYGLGVIYRNKGKNEKALEYFNNYLDYQSDPFDSVRVANVLFQISAVHLQIGQLEQATHTIVESIKIEEALGNDNSLANNYNVLAIIKKRSLLKAEVLPIYNKVLQLRKKLGDKSGEGLVLYNMGNFLLEQGDESKALNYFKEAERVAIGFESELRFIYEGMGRIFLSKEQIDSAQYYLNKCYDLRRKSGSDREIYITEHRLGQLEYLKNNFSKASQYFQNSLKIAQQQRETEKIAEISMDYSRSLRSQEKYSKSLEMAYLHIESRDSLLNTEIASQVEEINTRYQTEKREQEIALLNINNDLKESQLKSSRSIIFILGLGILLLSALLYRLFHLKRKVQKSEQEKDTLLREIHHRVKNNLQVISALLTLQSKHVNDDIAFEALQEGQGRVQSMALIHQDLYQHDNLKGVNTKDYFEKLIENLIDTYKTDERNIKLHCNIQPILLDVDTMIPLGLLVNELTSNSLKHAFTNMVSGNISINLREISGQLHVSVKDDGLGADPIQLENNSFGYSLIKSFARRLDAELVVGNHNGLQVALIINNYKKAA